MALTKNLFVETILPASILRALDADEMAEYRRPFVEPGEGRRPTVTWPREIPIDGEPADVTTIVQAYADWLVASEVPKLFVNAEPGFDPRRPATGVLSDVAQPDRSHRRRKPFHPGGQRRLDRAGDRGMASHSRLSANEVAMNDPRTIQSAQVVLPCADLDPTVEFFVDRLGFRLDAIFPADDPSVAVLSGHGATVRLDGSRRRRSGSPAPAVRRRGAGRCGDRRRAERHCHRHGPCGSALSRCHRSSTSS